MGVSCVGLVLACGGEAERAGDEPFAAGGATVSGGKAAAAAGGAFTGGVSTGGRTSSMEPPFIDPGCPELPPVMGIVECEPFAPNTGCLPGYGCYPYVNHPAGNGCGSETFGALCRPAGDGVDGALCGDGTSGCAAGYMCVLGARAGRRCAKMCPVGGPDTCTDGTICEDTDVQGYGVCN